MVHALLDVPLPARWPELTKTAVVHAVGLARFALMHVRGWCADSRLARVQLAGERDAALAKSSLLVEELRIVRARLAAVPARRRPHYAPEDRLAILELRAAAGWTVAETARRMLVTTMTVRSWTMRLDEEGPDALLRLRGPVNRYPDFVTAIVQAVATSFPVLGVRRIADCLARSGLHLADSTVRRMTHAPAVKGTPEPPRPSRGAPTRRVTSKCPDHLWHVDLTLLPAITGWWVSWPGYALAQRWPACFWLGVVLDHFSRSVVAWRLWRKEPTADEVCALLERARERAGRGPRHIVTDKGAQFQSAYRAWCERWGAKPRWGALGEHGSIAVIERFFRSLKDEMLRRLPLALVSQNKLEAEIAAYVGWYDEHRPHRALGGRTPREVRERGVARRDRPRLEVRDRHPLARGDPPRLAKRLRGQVALEIACSDGRAHLPIVRLRSVA